MFNLQTFYFTALIVTVATTTYTPEKLFEHADVNHDGIITEYEFKTAIKQFKTIEIDRTPCSCFTCDGKYLPTGYICDVYDNSKCDNPNYKTSGCYTTNTMKCNCNSFSNNPYVTKIPLTHSFTNYTPPSISKHNINLVERSLAAFQRSHKETTNNKYYYEGDMDSSYQKGRNSAMNDIADAVVTYAAVDAGLSLFEAALESKS